MKSKANNKVKNGFTLPNFSKKNLRGFTLIELLVVIAIIGILAGIVLVALSGARNRAKDARITSDMAQIRTQGELIFSSDGNYNNVDCAVGNIKTLCDDIATQGPAPVTIKPALPVDEYCAEVELNSGQFWCVDNELNSVQGACTAETPFVCVAGGSGGGGGPFVLDLTIGADEDDVSHREDHTFSVLSVPLWEILVGNWGQDYEGGFRFSNMEIPPGSTITFAYLEFRFGTGSYGNSFIVRGENSGDSLTIVDDADWHSRSMTSNSVIFVAQRSGWSQGAPGEVWGEEEPRDISAIIQEIIDNNPAWSSGNAMTFFVFRNGGNNSSIKDFGTFNRAKLHIEYTAP